MKTYISILRGINVGGHRILKMEILKKRMVDMGFEEVKTYIQSGNIVFKSRLTDTQQISTMLSSDIQSYFGFEVFVITFEDLEFEGIITKNPFVQHSNQSIVHLHVTFLAENPQAEHMVLLKNVVLQNDDYKVVGRCIYLYCPDGYGNTKLNNQYIEKQLQLSATTRNWKTVLKLNTLAQQG